jgi:uncharacterized protein
VKDVRGAVAGLPEAERAEIGDQELPAFAQVWALGFMFVVENWAEEWAEPRDKEVVAMLNDALEAIVAQLPERLNSQPDYITLSGSGEPTLYSRVGELIAVLDGLYQATSDDDVAE